MSWILVITSISKQHPAYKKHARKNKVHAPTPQYKIYLRDDDERVHACHYHHQIGCEVKMYM
jgi:hypothetical protein